MEKKEFTVTKLAGRSIAGVRNPGLGGSVMLTEKQAEHLVRLGQLAPAGKVERKVEPAPDLNPDQDEAPDAEADEKPATRSRRRRKSDGGD